MRVFLIHGMGRTPISLGILAWRLKQAGHRPSLFGYLVTRTDLAEITRQFVAHVRSVIEEDTAEAATEPVPFAVIGHSLGNVVVRAASPDLPPGFRRFVMLAPPNRPPVLVRTLRDNPLFRVATQDAGQKLDDEEFFAALPVPAVPALIIAGTRGPRAPWLPFQGEPNDSILRVEETRLPGVPMVEVPGIHTFLMNRRDVFAAVRDFLDSEPTPAVDGGNPDGAPTGRDKVEDLLPPREESDPR